MRRALTIKDVTATCRANPLFWVIAPFGYLIAIIDSFFNKDK